MSATLFAAASAGLARAGAAVALALLLAGSAAAQYGQIRGTITDAETGETLPGVNVVIEGTTQGAATDANGQFVIIGLRPDTYTVVISFIGYQTVRIEDVRVRIDLSTQIDVQLREEIFEGQEIVVTAHRDLVQRDLTSTTAIISADEIRALPVENFADVVELQAGVINGHFRGGRLGEVGYWIDGLPVQDVYDGRLRVTIENEMVQEAQIVTGTFNAEFGQAMSGIVNVVTKDGSNDFAGSFSGFLGDYLTGDDQLPTGMSPFPDLDTFSATNVQNAELTLSGPIMRDRLFFFTSARYFNNDGWIWGRNVFGYDDVVTDQAGRLVTRTQLIDPETGDFFQPSGDSSAVAMNPYERFSGQAKLTAHLGGGVRIAGNVMASREDFKDFDLARFFFPASQLQNRRDAINSYLKLTHALSNTTFYEAGITNNYTEFEQFLFEDVDDPRYRDRQYFDYTDPLRTSNFRVGGTDNRRFFRSTSSWLLKADLSSQINHENLIKVGVEARYHTLRFCDREVLIGGWSPDAAANEPAAFCDGRSRVFGDGHNELADHGSYRYNPIEFSAYAQDKIEIGDLIINVGLRFDYFDAAAPVFRDPTDPDAVFPTRRRCVGFNESNQCLVDDDGNEIWFDNIYTPDAHFQPASAKWQLSPRIGVAFPVTAGGVFHFSYGHFFQRPTFEQLYTNPYYLIGSGGSGLIGLVGNPDLRPEQTISGEVGMKQQLTPTSAIEVTAYYRDIRNLTGTALEPIRIRGTGARYGQFGNTDFGFVRGIILRYDQRFAGDFYAGLDYTFQVARANASDPSQTYSAAASRVQLEQRILPTDWDQLHTITVSLAYNNPEWDAGFGLIATYGSGMPYTPQQIGTGGGDIGPGRILLNSEIKPDVVNIDLTLHKNFQFFDSHAVQLYTKVDNVLDVRNEVDVFSETGTATYSLFRNQDLQSFQGDRNYLNRWYTRPGYFSQPRRFVVGLRYSF